MSFMRFAICGISSLMWTPGTEVGMAANGPPVGRPGFGSHVSNWLAPPASQSRMTLLPLALSVSFSAGLAKECTAPMPLAARPVPAPSVRRKARRLTSCSEEPQKWEFINCEVACLMIKPKLCAGQQ